MKILGCKNPFWLLLLASCCIHLAICDAAEEQGSEGILQQEERRFLFSGHHGRLTPEEYARRVVVGVKMLATGAMAAPDKAARLMWCRIGKGAMGARHITGRVLGPAWNALNYTCETFGTATVAVLVGVKRTLEASFYAFSIVALVIRDVASPCKPHGMFDCSVVGRGIVAWSKSASRKIRSIPIIGFLGRLESPRNLEESGLASFLRDMTAEAYTTVGKRGGSSNDLDSLVSLMRSDVLVNAYGALPEGMCSPAPESEEGNSSSSGCLKQWKGVGAVRELLGSLSKPLQSFVLRQEPSTFLVDTSKMCVHASGTQIGLSKGGEQLQGRFDHTICYDVEGMIKSVSANWNLVPQAEVMTDQD